MKKNRSYHSFEDWHIHDIERLLQVHPLRKAPELTEWVSELPPVPERLLVFLTDLQAQLYRYFDSWNETELFGKFISPVLNSIRPDTDTFSLFHERPLKATVGGYTVSGIVDGMMATGTYEPEKPYFFFHEYKRMKGSSADPQGQLLISMLAGQALNDDGFPIYGCYVIGRYWTFVYLHGDFFSESQGYDAVDEDELKIIWGILQKTKLWIEQRASIIITHDQQHLSRL